MKTTNSVKFKTRNGLTLEVPLEEWGDRESGTIFIDDVPYHIERMSKRQFCRKYKIDADPSYDPQADGVSRCVVVVPFCNP